jgi:hypothetical protein
MLIGVIAEESLLPSAILDSFIVRETASAADLASGGFLFSLHIDDPAAATDAISANVAQMVIEAASSHDTTNAISTSTSQSNEATTASSTQDATKISAATTWNPADKGANITLSNGNLTIANSSTVAGVRGTTSKTTGKVYYEMSWTGSNFNFLTSSGCGVSLSTASLISTNPPGVAYLRLSNGEIMNNGVASGTILGAVTSGQTICMAFDIAARRIWFRVNNGLWNNSGSADPASNVGGLDVSATFTAGASLYPHASASSGVTAGTVDFGATSFAFSIPSGFVAWG